MLAETVAALPIWDARPTVGGETAKVVSEDRLRPDLTGASDARMSLGRSHRQ